MKKKIKKISLTVSILVNIALLGLIISYGIRKQLYKEKMNLTKEDHYYNRKTTYEIMPKSENDIIFLGNSITDCCEWSELFQNSNIKNRGIAGDNLNMILDRIDNIVEGKPSKIFLMTGINDLNIGNDINDILYKYEKLIQIITTESPKTTLYIQSILPVYERESISNEDIKQINNSLSILSQKYNLTYIDLYSLMKSDDDKLNKDYSFDGLHINGKGYLVWEKAIELYIP